MALPNLNDLLAKRNTIESQLNQASAPISQNEALRYLQQGVSNFQPLQQERQALLTQANDMLPQQINEYTTQRQANPMSGVSSRAALQNILQNQNRLRGTANLVGDTINTAQGRLGDLSKDALSMLAQQNALLGRQFDVANQDYGTQRGFDFQANQAQAQRDFQARQEQIARDFQERMTREARRASGGGSRGGSRGGIPTLTRPQGLTQGGVQGQNTPITFTPEEQANQQQNNPDVFKSTLDLVNRAGEPIRGFGRAIRDDVENTFNTGLDLYKNNPAVRGILKGLFRM